MQEIILHISNPSEDKTFTLEDELSFGRTDLAQIVLDDIGLSSKNTTFFRDGDECLMVDEDSLNGTFLNGEKISGAPVHIFDGDEIKIGSETIIRVEIDGQKSEVSSQQSDKSAANSATSNERRATNKPANQKPKTKNQKPNKPPFALIAAGASSLLIVVIALVAILFARSCEGGGKNGKPTPAISTKAAIPIRVVDPLGAENPDEMDELIASLEVDEKELEVSTVENIKVTSTETVTAEDTELANATVELLAERQKKSLEPRNAEVGIRPAGLNVPRELYGDGVVKQTLKLAEMKAKGYQQPMDFSDLAQKRLDKQLVELPMATKSYYLVVGGSATDSPFTSFSFKDRNVLIAPGSPKQAPLARLAENFAGQKFSLDEANHRKQMRVRLLRMFNERAKPILEELARHYFQKYNRPLRVTSLTRSMDYQILLNATNKNSYPVRGEGSLPPHTSGCAFDLARKHMTAEEQNFVMEKLAAMEKERRLDALIEYNVNACWHVFIYDDGNPPKGY